MASAVKPARTVVMHLAPDWSTDFKTSNQRDSRARVDRNVEAFPDTIVFEAALETRRFEWPADEED